MKLSELMKKLAEIQVQHGDINICWADGDAPLLSLLDFDLKQIFVYNNEKYLILG